MIEQVDLSSKHGPIGSLFANGSSDIVVTDEQRGFFDDNGYVAGIKLLDSEQLDALRNDLAVMMMPDYGSDDRFYEYNLNESADKSKILFHALGAWRVSRSFHDLIFFAPLASAFSTLLDGPVRFWHDQVFVKPARDGAVVAWHQDYSYWTRTKPVAHLTCWIGLDDSTVENGCVHYVPGSHRWDLLPRGGLADEMDSVQAHLTDQQKAEFRPAAVELRAGEASFHHPMTLHGSYENHSDRPRRAAVINVFRDGVISDTDEPLLEGVPPIPKGCRIEGQFFPLLTPQFVIGSKTGKL